MTAKQLSPSKLRSKLDPEKIQFADSSEIPITTGTYDPFQPRALQAFRMALAISGSCHNVYLSGESNLGRSYFAREYFELRAAKQPVPPDQLYLYNFADEDKPIAVSLPAGNGKKFKTTLSDAVTLIKEKLPAWFEREPHLKAHERISRTFQDERDDLVSDMEELAKRNGFSLEVDDHDGLTLIPLIEGRILSDEEFERLDQEFKKTLRNSADDLLAEVTTILRQISKTEEGFRKDERKLHQDSAKELLKDIMAPLHKNFNQYEKIKTYLEDVEEELLDNIDLFMAKEAQPIALPTGLHIPDSSPTEDLFSRFDVNLLVDNSTTKGAPVVMADHPTAFNLLGSIDRESEMGALYTDFTLIRAGAIHKANHGYLIMYAEDVLTNPSSWEGLLRALRTGKAKLEDPGDGDQIRTKSLEPEPIPLELTVILIGSEETYEILLYNDERFGKYFKLKAHMQLTAERNAANIRRFVEVLGKVIHDTKLIPFNREALAGLVDYSSRLAEDQKRISLGIPFMKEVMVEASALAVLDGKKIVDRESLNEAIEMRDYRSNLYEDEFMTEYDREVIKVETSGKGVGRANGLSVTMFGDYEFGLPHQISCTVGVGHGGIIDLEREARMGGPIHTKGMMIIKSYLVGLFAQDKPIVLTGSLCFEQSYAGIEGDSASGAELATLLSALSGVPIKFNYAFTGAVSQTGSIMAVGGVNRKIEGFYEVCRRRGFSGEQGVLIPADNVVNLMLRHEIVEAVEQGKFHIYPVKTIEEALSILTGVKIGKISHGRKFPLGSLYRKADDRLAELAEIARRSECKSI
ncbi:ATP-binding protein [Desulfovibrio gilichinskyi]|uniref:endopeptidase La n=1 Tax=Desulfovibrio gilichinskyi TaxID=1519643 RepID=A0A1X7EER9_9BACT|nr:ATP-binding protein [Desulfovibrio gilichinskyi]SMF32657.1 lon-related putative ATP-dependent protease [Desulfovibrio gilichinskyi]